MSKLQKVAKSFKVSLSMHTLLTLKDTVDSWKVPYTDMGLGRHRTAMTWYFTPQIEVTAAYDYNEQKWNVSVDWLDLEPINPEQASIFSNNLKLATTFAKKIKEELAE
jgi:hypothetical protein